MQEAQATAEREKRKAVSSHKKVEGYQKQIGELQQRPVTATVR